jgi:hypothetical protein
LICDPFSVLLKLDDKGVIELDQASLRVLSFISKSFAPCVVSFEGNWDPANSPGCIFHVLCGTLERADTVATSSLQASVLTCVLCREGDVSVRGTNRAIGLGVDEAEKLEAGRSKFEAGLAEMASGNHRTGEEIGGRTVPRGIGCQLGEQAEERG